MTLRNLEFRFIILFSLSSINSATPTPKIENLVSSIVNNFNCGFGIVYPSSAEGIISAILENMSENSVLSINYETWVSGMRDNQRVIIFSELEHIVPYSTILQTYTKFSQCHLFLVIADDDVGGSSNHEALLALANIHSRNIYDFQNHYIFIQNSEMGMERSTNKNSQLGRNNVMWLRNKIEIKFDRGMNHKTYIESYNVCFYCYQGHSFLQKLFRLEYQTSGDILRASNAIALSLRQENGKNLRGLRFQTRLLGGQETCEGVLASFKMLDTAPRKVYWIYRMSILTASIGQQMNFSCNNGNLMSENPAQFDPPNLSLFVSRLTPEDYRGRHFFPVITIEAMKTYFGKPREFISWLAHLKTFDPTTWFLTLCSFLASVSLFVLTNRVVDSVKFGHRFRIEFKARRTYTQLISVGIEQSFKMLCTQNTEERAKNSSEAYRLFLTTKLMLVLLLSSIFAGIIVNHKVVPDYIYIPRTMKALAQSNFKIEIKDTHFGILEDLSLFKELEVGRMITYNPKWNDSIHQNEKRCLAETFLEPKVCIFVNSDVDCFGREYFSDIYGDQIYESGSDRINMIFNVPSGVKYAIYSEAMDTFVYRAIAGGLTNRWYAQEFISFRRRGRWLAIYEFEYPDQKQWPHLSRVPESKGSYHLRTVNIHYVKGEMVMLLFGLVVGLIVFFKEILQRRCYPTSTLVQIL